MGDFVLLGGDGTKFYAVRLALVQLAAESGGVGIWSVAPGRMELSFDVDFPLLLILYHVQRWVRMEGIVWFFKAM